MDSMSEASSSEHSSSNLWDDLEASLPVQDQSDSSSSMSESNNADMSEVSYPETGEEQSADQENPEEVNFSAMQAFLADGQFFDQPMDSEITEDAVATQAPASQPEQLTLPPQAQLLGIFGEDGIDPNLPDPVSLPQANLDLGPQEFNESASHEVYSQVETPLASSEVQDDPSPLEEAPHQVPEIDWSERARLRRRARLEHYKQVFQEYRSLKRSLKPSASVPSLTEFIDQLNSARQKYISKNDCPDVRFSVYEKKGKAAIKARPYTPDQVWLYF